MIGLVSHTSGFCWGKHMVNYHWFLARLPRPTKHGQRWVPVVRLLIGLRKSEPSQPPALSGLNWRPNDTGPRDVRDLAYSLVMTNIANWKDSPCNEWEPSRHFSIDWLKGKSTRNSQMSWENLWFPVDFPLSQPIECWKHNRDLRKWLIHITDSLPWTPADSRCRYKPN